jgi:hypothetical protein
MDNSLNGLSNPPSENFSRKKSDGQSNPLGKLAYVWRQNFALKRQRLRMVKSDGQSNQLGKLAYVCVASEFRVKTSTIANGHRARSIPPDLESVMSSVGYYPSDISWRARYIAWQTGLLYQIYRRKTSPSDTMRSQSKISNGYRARSIPPDLESVMSSVGYLSVGYYPSDICRRICRL